ncbi:MAG: metal ABC transporter permease [Thermoprotei archaeon]
MINLMNPFIINAIIGIILGSLAALIAGTISMLRGVHYLSAEVTHAALGGAAIGALVYEITHIDLMFFVIALLFSILTAMFTGYITRKGGIEVSGLAIGLALAFSLSIYAIVIGLIPAELQIRVNSYLISDILLLTNADLIYMTTTIVTGLLIVFLFYNEVIYTCFDLEGTEALGLRTRIYDYIIFALVGIAGVVIAKAVGALLVFALAIVPAATAKELSDSIPKLFFYTFIIALISGFFGLFLSILINFPTSGMIAMVASLIYLIVIIARKLINR